MDRLKEECGVFGIFNNKDAAALTALGLHALQHRGQEGCGIITYDGNNFFAERRLGLVGDNFTKDKVLEKLPGNYAIGHNRYSTAGNNLIKNVQPFFADLHSGGISIAHNGNLSNAKLLRKELVKNGSIFQTTSDTETIVQLIAKSKRPNIIDKIIESLFILVLSYNFFKILDRILFHIRVCIWCLERRSICGVACPGKIRNSLNNSQQFPKPDGFLDWDTIGILPA